MFLRCPWGAWRGVCSTCTFSLTAIGGPFCSRWLWFGFRFALLMLLPWLVSWVVFEFLAFLAILLSFFFFFFCSSSFFDSPLPLPITTVFLSLTFSHLWRRGLDPHSPCQPFQLLVQCQFGLGLVWQLSLIAV